MVTYAKTTAGVNHIVKDDSDPRKEIETYCGETFDTVESITHLSVPPKKAPLQNICNVCLDDVTE